MSIITPKMQQQIQNMALWAKQSCHQFTGLFNKETLQKSLSCAHTALKEFTPDNAKKACLKAYQMAKKDPLLVSSIALTIFLLYISRKCDKLNQENRELSEYKANSQCQATNKNKELQDLQEQLASVKEGLTNLSSEAEQQCNQLQQTHSEELRELQRQLALAQTSSSEAEQKGIALLKGLIQMCTGNPCETEGSYDELLGKLKKCLSDIKDEQPDYTLLNALKQQLLNEGESLSAADLSDRLGKIIKERAKYEALKQRQAELAKLKELYSKESLDHAQLRTEYETLQRESQKQVRAIAIIKRMLSDEPAAPPTTPFSSFSTNGEEEYRDLFSNVKGIIQDCERLGEENNELKELIQEITTSTHNLNTSFCTFLDRLLLELEKFRTVSEEEQALVVGYKGRIKEIQELLAEQEGCLKNGDIKDQVNILISINETIQEFLLIMQKPISSEESNPLNQLFEEFIRKAGGFEALQVELKALQGKVVKLEEREVELEEKVAALEIENEGLRAEKLHLQELLKLNNEEKEQLQREIGLLEEQIEELKLEKQKEIYSYTQQLVEQGKTLTQKDEQLLELQQKLKESNREKLEIQGNYEALEREFQQLEEQLNQTKEDLNAKEFELQTLQGQIKAINNQQREETLNIQDLQATIKTLEGQLETETELFREVKNTLEKEKAELGEKIDKLEHQISQISQANETNHTAKEEELTLLTQQVLILRAQLEGKEQELNNYKADYDKLIDTANAQWKHLEEKNSSSINNLQALGLFYNQLISQYEKLQTENQSLQFSASQLQSQIDQQTPELESAREQLAKARKSYEEKYQQLTLSYNRVLDEKRQVDRELAEKKEELNEKMREVGTLKHRIDDLNRELVGYKAEQRKILEERLALQAEIDKKQKQLVLEKEEYERNIQVLEIQIQEANDKIEQKSKESEGALNAAEQHKKERDQVSQELIQKTEEFEERKKELQRINETMKQALKGELEQAQQELQEKERALQDLQETRLTDLTREIKDLETQMLKLSTDIDGKDQEIQNLQSNKESIEESMQRIEELEANEQQLRLELARVQESLDDTLQEKQEIIEDMQQELNSALEELEESIEGLKEDFSVRLNENPGCFDDLYDQVEIFKTRKLIVFEEGKTFKEISRAHSYSLAQLFKINESMCQLYAVRSNVRSKEILKLFFDSDEVSVDQAYELKNKWESDAAAVSKYLLEIKRLREELASGYSEEGSQQWLDIISKFGGPIQTPEHAEAVLSSWLEQNDQMRADFERIFTKVCYIGQHNGQIHEIPEDLLEQSDPFRALEAILDESIKSLDKPTPNPKIGSPRLYAGHEDSIEGGENPLTHSRSCQPQELFADQSAISHDGSIIYHIDQPGLPLTGQFLRRDSAGNPSENSKIKSSEDAIDVLSDSSHDSSVGSKRSFDSIENHDPQIHDVSQLKSALKKVFKPGGNSNSVRICGEESIIPSSVTFGSPEVTFHPGLKATSEHVNSPTAKKIKSREAVKKELKKLGVSTPSKVDTSNGHNTRSKGATVNRGNGTITSSDTVTAPTSEKPVEKAKQARSSKRGNQKEKKPVLQQANGTTAPTDI